MLEFVGFKFVIDRDSMTVMGPEGLKWFFETIGDQVELTEQGYFVHIEFDLAMEFSQMKYKDVMKVVTAFVAENHKQAHNEMF